MKPRQRLGAFAAILLTALALGGFTGPTDADAQLITANRLILNGAALGSSPSIQAIGQDTNISITLIPKGTGVVVYTGSFASSASATSTTNVQPLSGDLTLTGAGLGHTGGYYAGVMGNVLNTGSPTAAGNNASTTAGVIGKYSVTGTTYTPGYPRAGVVGEAAGARTDAAVVAVMTDGDNPGLTVGAFYGVDYQVGPASTLNYGLDLRGATHDPFYSLTPVYAIGDIRLGNGGLIASVTVAITANVTSCSQYAAGTWVQTTNATGRATIWICDGTVYQKTV